MSPKGTVGSVGWALREGVSGSAGLGTMVGTTASPDSPWAKGCFAEGMDIRWSSLECGDVALLVFLLCHVHLKDG